MYKSLWVFAVLAVSLPCFAQTPAAPVVGTAPNKAVAPATSYADEAVVVQSDDVVYRFAADGTGTKRETTVLRMQSSAALQSFGVLSFPYASSTQKVEIVYARVRKPDGTVVETPVSDAQDQPAQVTQLAPMYSDLHLKQIPVRSLAVGDKLEFEILLTMQQPEVPGEFWGTESFGAGIVYLERSIELHVPKQKALTVESPGHAPAITEAGAERVYRWTGAQLRPTSAKADEGEPQDTKPPIAWTTFPNWEAVGVWYRNLIAGRDAVTPAIQAKADELTAGAKTDADKVRALYTYVATHNHYIGINFGIGHYQPHMAAEILTNQYGDCKDKHTLLAALLRAKGFPVSAVLIGDGIEMNQKVPMPGAFNHLITQVQVGGEAVWLDATAEVAPYRALVASLRDKDALVIPPTGAPHLEKTPARLPFAAVTEYAAKATLDKSGSLKGHFEITLRGDDEIIMRAATRQIARTQWDQLSQNYSHGSGYGGTTSGTVLDAPEEMDGPWHMRYDYERSPYGDWDNYRIVALLPSGQLPGIDEKKPPKEAIELGGPHTQLATSTIHLPEGYSASLPDALHLKTAFATLDKTYQLKDGDLIAQRRLEVLVDKIPAADWKDYKKFLDDFGDEPWIQLTRTMLVAGEKGPPLAGEENAVAAELVRQAGSALQPRDRDLDLAKKKLDQAANVNEKQKYLWAEYGFMAELTNQYEGAVADLRKELTLHPDESSVYPALIYSLVKLDKKAEQRDTLLAYAKAEPKKDAVVLSVGQQLLAADHVSDAVTVYRAGVQAIPENRSIQIGLGGALLRAGSNDEAVKVLKAALDGASDPLDLNNGAYELANDNLELPLAESYARKAVDALEAESAKTELESVNAGSFRRAMLLLNTWDTLGWIYFAEGKTDLAEQYVRAAWRSGTNAESGLHLGKILEKLGEREQAMQLYELALAGHKGVAASSVSDELHAHMDALKKAGIAPQNAGGDRALQEQRTFHVPRPSGLKGSAVFLLEASPAKTEKVRLASGDEALAERTDALLQLDLKLDLPKDSHGLLLRSGVMFCSTEATCEFVLTPPESANIQ